MPIILASSHPIPFHKLIHSSYSQLSTFSTNTMNSPNKKMAAAEVQPNSNNQEPDLPIRSATPIVQATDLVLDQPGEQMEANTGSENIIGRVGATTQEVAIVKSNSKPRPWESIHPHIRKMIWDHVLADPEISSPRIIKVTMECKLSSIPPLGYDVSLLIVDLREPC